ncbi:MAG: cryptochrome/photolyase family protein [Pseudomonadota bacterium]
MVKYHLILPDQLFYEQIDVSAGKVVIMLESVKIWQAVPHHKQKIAMITAAMRHFAKQLVANGTRVIYHKFDLSLKNYGYVELLQHLVANSKVEASSEYTVISPSEYWLHQTLSQSNFNITFLSSPHDITSKEQFANWAKGKKQLIMEYFYRENRRRTGLLMTADGQPQGGAWNYDKQNRKPLKASVQVPMNYVADIDDLTKQVINEVNNIFADNFGNLDVANFYLAVTHSQAEEALTYFCKYLLPFFGDYQDAMQTGQPFVFHSILSAYINIGLLHPFKVCQAVEAQYYAGLAPLNAVEGYIRQIIGWREYIKGIYWHYMPEYKQRNTMDAKLPLPKFYWHGRSKLNCINQVVHFTNQYAYSHHIQRLMVTGNFALLAGLSPQEVNKWYLAVYADAWEWVELPNTHGMALHADGGVVGTKPYIASGAYINRMSNYCKNCEYNVKQRSGADACPFNVLYWHFLMRHQQRFKNNNRMNLAYNNLAKINDDERQRIWHQGEKILAQLN